MKTLRTIIAGLICFGVSVSSCSDDFVDVDPPNQINSENFFNSEEDYQAAVIAAYDLLSTHYQAHLISVMASDDALCGGENANDVPGFQEIDDMEHNGVNDQLRNLWNWMYAGVNRCNYVFEFETKTDFEGRDALMGEVAFLRAFYFFELVKFFGPIPLPVGSRVEFGEEKGFSRSSVEDVYAQIEADLNYAIERLPESQAELGRATSWAAKALLGKAQLYQDKFAEASVTLEDVILNGPFDLVDAEDYEAMFLEQGENGIESVFEIQYSESQGGGFGCFQCIEGNVAPGFNSIRGYSGPVYESGFSFNVMTQELVDAFEEGDIRLPVAVLDIEAFAAEQSEPVSWIEGFEHTGYYNQKYIKRVGESDEFGDPNLTSNKNYRAIRFADVLLMAAEAFNRSGNDTKGQEYLNRVRQRAGLGDIAETGQALTQAIWNERRVELAGEGQRFFDLVRTGQAATEIDGFISGTHELFPIPFQELDLMGGLPQNPGYPEVN